jgi:hypothetical protein
MSKEDMDKLIGEFCSQELGDLHDGDRKRRSILLQIQKDMDYNLGVHKSFRELNLTDFQQSKLDSEIAPLIVPPLLLVSAIDSLARVLSGGSRLTTNRNMFQDSAKRLFELDDDEVLMMWELRNSLTHAYSLTGYSFVRYKKGGFGSRISRVIAIRPMRGLLQKAARNLEAILLGLSISEKEKVCRYIEEFGFIYYFADDNANTDKSGY